jgi:hypothetical protein
MYFEHDSWAKAARPLAYVRPDMYIEHGSGVRWIKVQLEIGL